jgi:endonuclease/exonuclease/phosphatase (EEP) superfamily protein YafD
VVGAGYRARIGPRSLLRIPVFVAAVLALAAALVARLEWTAWPFELFTNFPVQIFLIGFVVTLVAVLVRAPVSAVLAALAALLTGLTVAGTLTTDAPTVRPNGDRVTLGHLNAQSRAVDVDRLGAYLERTKPDVFVVLDPLQSDVPRFRHAVPGYETTATGSHQERPSSYVRAVVLSRRALTGVGHPHDRAFGPSAVEMTIPSADGPIAAVIFGTDSPTTPAREGHRNRSLRAAARWSRVHGARRVVEGDFNATPWSPEFRALVHDGRLTSSLDGFGLQVSWPESNVLLRIPIDHALLGPGLATTDRGTGPSFGSQHRSLHVTVGPAG